MQSVTPLWLNEIVSNQDKPLNGLFMQKYIQFVSELRFSNDTENKACPTIIHYSVTLIKADCE